MAERTIHRQWRDAHADSKYPFADSATLVSRTGGVLNKAIFLDASIYPIGGAASMYLSSVVIAADTVTLYIGTLKDAQLCSGVFDQLSPPGTIRLTDTWDRAAGVLVSDALLLAEFQSWAPGEHAFDQAAGEFAASVCVPTPELGVRGLITEDGELFTGDVWITGEYGVVVREDTSEAHGTLRVIRIDIVGDPLFRRLLCEGTAQSPLGPVDLFAAVNYLKTINGVAPDKYGDWKITAGDNVTADTILRIYPTAAGVKFEAVGERTVE